MYSITDLKKGVHIELDGEPYVVTEYAQKQVGRGGSIVNVKVKNLIDGHVEAKTFKGSEKIKPASLERKRAQYLYKDEEHAYFMDDQTFEQFSLPLSVVEDSLQFLPEGALANTIFFNERVINVELPPKVPLTVEYTEDVVKGDTQSTVLKDAKLETGLVVAVPIFIKIGDVVIVDTRNSSYVERQK